MVTTVTVWSLIVNLLLYSWKTNQLLSLLEPEVLSRSKIQ